MSKLKQDFAAATEAQQIKYCANVIEEASFAGKSAQKIKEMLLKTGAKENIISEAYDMLENEELPSEIQKAWQQTEKLLRALKDEPCSDEALSCDSTTLEPGEIRKILSKLSYMGFEEEIVYEIMERLS